VAQEARAPNEGGPNEGGPTPLVAVILSLAPLDAARVASVCAEVWPVELGELTIEARAEPWPDEAPGIPGLAPFTLERAVQQPHIWPTGASFARRHRCHVVLTVRTEGEATLAALSALGDTARALLAEPDAVAVFFPRGEALRDGHVLGAISAGAREQEAVPLQCWTNGRLADPGEGWRIADTVGLGQLGAPDQEAAFPADLAPPFEVLGFLFDLAHHLVAEGGSYENGLTIDGPGGKRWMARRVLAPFVEPERPCVRWMPLGLPSVPAALLGHKSSDHDSAANPATD